MPGALAGADPHHVALVEQAGAGQLLACRPASFDGLTLSSLVATIWYGTALLCIQASICRSSLVGPISPSTSTNTSVQRLTLQQVPLDHRLPGGSLAAGHLGVAVAGQVDDRRAVGQDEQVEQLGATRGVRDLGELAAVGQRVDQRRLADVRAPDERDLARRVGQVDVALGGGDERQLKGHGATARCFRPRPATPARAGRPSARAPTAATLLMPRRKCVGAVGIAPRDARLRSDRQWCGRRRRR